MLSVQKADRHLLLHLRALQCATEVVERNFAHPDRVRFHDRTLGDAVQLILANVRTHHHLQYVQQLVTRDRFIIVQIVHLECEAQLLLAAVQPVLLVRLDRSEVGKDARELAKVDPIIVTVGEERMDDTLAQWVNGQLRDAQKVFP